LSKELHRWLQGAVKLRAGVDGVPKYPDSDRDAAENPKGYVFDICRNKYIYKYIFIIWERERKHGTNRNSSTHGFSIKSSQHWKAASTHSSVSVQFDCSCHLGPARARPG
jgi:hypothetical protein